MGTRPENLDDGSLFLLVLCGFAAPGSANKVRSFMGAETGVLPALTMTPGQANTSVACAKYARPMLPAAYADRLPPIQAPRFQQTLEAGRSNFGT